MKPHVKIYFDYFNINYNSSGWHDFIACEVCHKPANQIHHVNFRSQLGGDDISNLMALCMNCHNKAHSEILTKEYLTEIHNNKINDPYSLYS